MNYYGYDKTTLFAGFLTTLTALFLIGTIISFIFALPVMWLWNWLMPIIFKLPEISWLQAFGLILLSSFLFPKANTIINDKL